MNREALIRIVSEQMPEKRWDHTLGVMSSAVYLAKKYDANPQRAELAAILHDLAKYWSADQQKQSIIDDGRALELLQYEQALWHAEAGAITAERQLGITDEEVLQAIRYHTTGRVKMTKLEKIVCLADYIEPGRHYPGVDLIREQADISLEHGLVAALDHTMQFLIGQRKKIYPLTLEARNDLIDQIATS